MTETPIDSKQFCVRQGDMQNETLALQAIGVAEEKVRYISKKRKNVI